MPTYQYACMNADCGNQFELVQSFTDPTASQCPVCEGPVRKVFSAVGVVFKGSGFYRTDSRSGSDKAGAKPASSSSSSDSSSSSATPASSSPSSGSASDSASSSTSSSAPAKAAAS
jgi:putative FmdB family regulatory protein